MVMLGSRNVSVSQMENSSKNFDVVVIGAGINGAGVARDAAMRGLKVLLLDKADIASGTSSTSTRLIHGGLRYLEHGEFGLVRESLLERETLLRIAPHLVKPLPMLLPIYKHSHRGRLKVRAGLLAYDFLSQHKTLPRHRFLSLSDTIEHAPGLSTKDLLGAAVYFDAQAEYAERLVVENVISAVEHGAVVHTYCRVTKINVENGHITGVDFVDQLSNKTNSVKTTSVVNASGPWVDELIETMTLPKSRLIGATKGSHIVVPAFSGAPKVAMYVEARTDHRPFFVIPWNGQYLIGTTDLRYQSSLDDVHIDQSEATYLLAETNNLFPQAQLDANAVLFTFSGVRPLAHSAAKDEQSITRRHFIRKTAGANGLLSIVGGKLTTYRKVAEQTVDLVEKQSGGLSRDTAYSELPGGEGYAAFAEKFRNEPPFGKRTTERLLALYGARAGRVAELAESQRELARIVDTNSGGIAAEAIHAFVEELAQTLSDVMLRRTMWAFNSKGGFDVVDDVARVCANYFGWTSDRMADEIERFKREMRAKHSNKAG